MMGRNHIVAGLGLAALGASALRGAAHLEGMSWQGRPESLPGWAGDLVEKGLDALGSAASWAQGWLVPTSEGPWHWAYLAAAAALFVLGTLLPDIDSGKSILGRRMALPLGPHRGITHTDWALALLLVASLPGPTRALAFLWLGAVTHCELDGWSTAGRARLWPLGRHRTIIGPDGEPCVVRPSPRALHYRTGGTAEHVLAWGLAALGAASLFW